MIYQPSASAAGDISPSTVVRQQLDLVLARLAVLVATVETDRSAAGVAVALPRQRAALYAAMAAVGGWINAFLVSDPSTPKCCSLSLSAWETWPQRSHAPS